MFRKKNPHEVLRVGTVVFSRTDDPQFLRAECAEPGCGHNGAHKLSVLDSAKKSAREHSKVRHGK